MVLLTIHLKLTTIVYGTQNYVFQRGYKKLLYIEIMAFTIPLNVL